MGDVHSNWETPPCVAKRCVERMIANLTKVGALGGAPVFVDAGAGTGVWAAAARSELDRLRIERARVIAVEIETKIPPRMEAGIECHYGDFHAYKPPAGSSTIVFGNPPFTDTHGLEFVATAKRLGATSIAFLLPIGLLEPAENRGNFRTGLRSVYALPRFPFVDMHGEKSGSGSRPVCFYQWMGYPAPHIYPEYSFAIVDGVYDDLVKVGLKRARKQAALV